MKSQAESLLAKIGRIAPVALHEVRQAADGSLSMPRATADIVDIYGLTPEELAEDFSRAWALIHPDDHARIQSAVAESAKTLQRFRCEWRILHPTKGEIWVECRSMPERRTDGAITWHGYFHDITETKNIELSLHESQRSLAAFMDNMPGMAYRCRNDRDWTSDFVSTGATVLTGYAPEQFLAGDVAFNNLIHPDDQERVWRETQQAVAERKPFQLEYRMHTADGTEKYVWEQGRGVYDEQGNVLALEGVISDITERKLAEERLAILSFALNHVQEAALLIDQNARILYVNGEACRSLGYSREELLNLSIANINPGFDKERWQAHWHEIRTRGSISLETQHQRRDGSIFPVEVSANYFEYEGHGYNLALVRDITLRKEQERHIEYLAYHDALTGLPNRLMVMSRLEQALATSDRHKRSLAVLFIDLDRFKTINDTLGHPAGDLLLKQVGERLRQVIRRDDTVGRLGGDEFLITLSDLADPQNSLQVIEKIFAVLEKPFKVAGHELHVTTSLGVSLYPRDSDAAETLVRYADNALYLAKEEGRNTFRFFSPELDLKIHNRLHLENDLRGAQERNELFLHYQPQIRLATGAITGVEALARWQHPVRGLVNPAEFIPIAEEVGLIIPLGEWVLRTACQQASHWHRSGMAGMSISVNLSQRQLEQEDFAGRVAQILVETGCDPKLLELEITESSLMNNPDQAIAKLLDLHKMGIKLAMDDFGTGYSSLSYLKRLPLDRLKIDCSFVAGIPDDSHDMAIVEATIVLARQLGLGVVAEGVETEAQREFLAARGCDDIQGYLISKPVPAASLEKLLPGTGD